MCLWIPLAVSLALASCAPSPAPVPSRGAGEGGTTPFSAELQPHGSLEAAPPIVRIHLVAAPNGRPPDPTQVALIAGDVSSAHLGQLARDDVSMALSERIVPSLVWREGEAVVLAPLRALSVGERYAVASGTPKGVVELVVVEEDPVPHLALTWPPEGRGAGGWPARWCGATALAPGSFDVPLAPEGGAATLVIGAASNGAGAHCLRLMDPSDAPREAERIPPPALHGPDGAVLARLDPSPLSADAELAPVTNRPCDDEAPAAFGPGCARIWDDRAKVYPPDAPLLWVAAGLERTAVTEPGVPFLLDGLPPASTLVFDLVTVDNGGAETVSHLSLTTAAPMAHVVINEVLANPVGEEPEQEWVELYNDGLAPAHLDGWQLEDVGGEAPLPATTLPPGGFALVVNEAFDDDSEWDPMPPPTVPLLRVAELGNNGLANSGEPIRLRDAAGVIVSRFPAKPKPKAGYSVARIHPRALDEIEGNFVRVELPTPGEPNATVSSR